MEETNSATVFIPTFLAKKTIASTTAFADLVLFISWIIEPSSFIKSACNLTKYEKFEYPVPKSSMAIFTPRFFTTLINEITSSILSIPSLSVISIVRKYPMSNS